MDIFINKNIMARIIRLTENDLARIVKRVIMEQNVKSVKGGSSASNSTHRTTTPPTPKTTIPPLKTIVYTDPSLTKTITNIDIFPRSMTLVSRNVKFTYSVAGRNDKLLGIFYCNSANGTSGSSQVRLAGIKNVTFISPKRAATLKSKCGAAQGYASTNTGVDTTLA
jgi:hypothetical protein